jgi:DNA mismatch repair protein MutS2
MDSNLLSLEFDRVLTLVALQARTSAGKEAVLRRRPSCSIAECERSQAVLAEMRRYYLQEGPLPFGGITDIRPLLSGERFLELPDSWVVLRALRGMQSLREELTRTEDRYPLLREAASAMPDHDPLVTSVGRFFTRDGKLREEASATLRSLRTRVLEKRRNIQRTLTDLMNQHADAIQEPIITLRGDRYCIPVRTDHRSAVPGILHERSGSGASLFIEPLGIVEANNDLADLLIQEREEIARITRHIASLLLEARDTILDGLAVSAEIDAVEACAIVQDMLGGTRPRFTDERELRIVAGRHPLLDQRLADLRREAFGEEPSPQQVIPTSFELTGQACAILISGPNAGGKTVALKTAGLLVAMAAAGLPLPAADGTVIPVVDRLHVLIGDDQNVMEHLSTFSAYLYRLKRVLSQATGRSMVLLDELGSGTDPEEGAALASAVVEHVLATGSLLVVTTHLSALKSFAISDPRISNAAMEFDAATGRPTFQMVLGAPGRSRAIEIAEMMGLPPEVTAAARERLGDRYGDIDRLLAELQSKLLSVADQENRLRSAREEAEILGRNLAVEKDALEAERKKLARSLREEIERAKAEVGARLRAEMKSLREADRKAREQTTPAQLFERVIQPLEAVAPRDEAVAQLRVGDKAEHRRFRMVGEVVALDGTRARLSAGGKSIEVEAADLVPLRGEIAGRSPGRAPVASAADIAEPAIAAELHLIGRRVDESIEETDRFLDRALLEGKGAVRLIHGFGTGTLRKALREYLRRHRGVRSFRPGGEREGGDGATVVFLDI